MTWLCKTLGGQSREQKHTKVRKGEKSSGCDVEVNSAAEAYAVHAV